MATVNPKHYYSKIEEYSNIMDVFERMNYAGMLCSEIPSLRKRTWEKNFKLYRETEYILKKVSDPNDFTYFPLYRHLGQDDADYEFNSKEEALEEYESQIGESIYCYQHDC